MPKESGISISFMACFIGLGDGGNVIFFLKWIRTDCDTVSLIYCKLQICMIISEVFAFTFNCVLFLFVWHYNQQPGRTKILIWGHLKIL